MIAEKVIRLVAIADGAEPEEIRGETAFAELEIDSLEFLSLMSEVEEACGVKISDLEAQKVNTVGELISLVAGKLACA